MAKSDCMLAIVWLLKSRGRMTAKELAETLEISVRSIYRYVDSLCASGVPIEAESGHEGGYRLMHTYDGAPLFFTTEEKTALRHSALFAQKAGYPFTTDLENALRKIEYHSTQEQLDDIFLRSDGLHVVVNTDHSSYRDTLIDLEQAVARRQTVTIGYHKAKSETALRRQVDPYGLIHWRDRWYVVGYCHLRRDIRTFRVDRIREYEQSSEFFVRPDNFSAGDFFAAQQMTATSPDHLARVVLAGDNDSIDDLVKHWFMGPRMVTHSTHEALFLVEEETLLSYVPHILLPFGKSVHIVEPDSLKHRMVEITLEVASHYRDVH